MEVDEFLEHYGVLGMHWGQHKAKDTPSPRAQAKADQKEHKQWKKGANSSATANTVFQEALRTSKKPLTALMNSPKYKGKDFGKPENLALARQYDRESSQLFNDHMMQASVKHASNKAGDQVMMYQFDRNMGMMRATHMKRVEHGDQGWPDFKATLNAQGFIIDLQPVEPVAHDDLEARVADFLAHYGVLGMKWGQHLKDHGVKSTTKKAATTAKAAVKKDIKERTSTQTTVRAKPGQLVRVVGGNGRSAHDDAVKARTAEQIAKKNTLDALSNQELQHLVNRMNLESQYRNLASNETRVSAGEKFATDLLSKHDAKINTALAVGLGPAAPVGKMVIDGALKKATVNKAMLGGKVSDKKKNK
jgi:hypothetical protein